MKAKSLILIFFLVIFLISCTKDENQIFNENEAILNERNVERDSVYIGRKLQNPYNIRIIIQAYRNVKSAGLLKNDYQIMPDHFYVRFLPQSNEEYEYLTSEFNFDLFDYPLDYEIVGEGDFSYSDPNLGNDNYTWKYTVIDIDEEFPHIRFEILDTIFINEDDSYNYSIIYDEQDWKNIEQEAFRITGNLGNVNDDGVQAFWGCDEWNPSGTIRVHDDIVGGLIPLEGALVKVRRWFKIRKDYTDANGFFETSSFCGEVNYSIVWEHEVFPGFNLWDIRNGLWLQAYYNGPKQKGTWNLDIVSDRSLRYATIHRAAHRYHFLNIDGLKRPNVWSSLKYCYWHSEGTGNNWGNWDFSGIFPDINIWGANPNGGWWDTNQLFSTVIHETGHASHIELMNAGEIQFGQVTSQIYESWADAIEWHITQIEYNELGFPNYDDPWSSNYIDNHQLWIGARHRPDFSSLSDDQIETINSYTSLFIDLVDNYNQSLEEGSPPADRCPNGGTFDSSNCYVGTSPSGETAFIWDENFYYTPVGCCDCPQPGSSFDGANCYIMPIPENSIGFIESNSWYLFPAGDTTRPYDQVEDYTMGYLESNVMKHTYGLTSLRNNLKDNKPWGVTDKQIDIFLEYFFEL